MMSSNWCGKLDNALQEVGNKLGNKVGNTNIKVTKSYYGWGKQSPSGYTLTELTQKSGYDLTQLTAQFPKNAKN